MVFSTKSPWRRGAQILINEKQDARLLDRCEATRKEWAKHWQCGEDVQNVEEKPRKDEELRKMEEARPWLKEHHLESAEIVKSKNMRRV